MSQISHKLTEDGGRRGNNGLLRFDYCDLRQEDEQLRIESSNLRVEGFGSRMESLSLEETIMLHQHISLAIICRESRYFEEIPKL